jgi:hypothetical protein
MTKSHESEIEIDVYEIDAWMKGVKINLKGMNVCCSCDLNYANIDWRIDMLNCLWNLIENMC